MLEARARRLVVGGSMIFHNRFVSQDELTEFLSAADIYITPYLNPEQITSGTLAYAVGAGKAVLSTPYTYARELLADGRSVLVPWRDASAIADEVVDLVSDPVRYRAMCARAAAQGQAMTWPAVARQYVESFSRARANDMRRRRTSFQTQTLANRRAGWPEIDLRHVRALTDDTGILQHAVFSIPRYENGYCPDENARALLLMTLLDEAGTDDPLAVRALASRYLAFVNTPSIDRPGASGISSRTGGSGSSRKGRRIATAGHSGRSAQSWDGRPIPAGTALPASSFMPQCRPRLRLPAPGRGPMCCSASRSTYAPFRVTARSKGCVRS